MLLPLPNITYNVQDAVDYYNALNEHHTDLVWTKKETMRYINRGEMTIIEDKDRDEDEQWEQFLKAVNYQKPFIDWTKDECLKFSREHFDKFTAGMKIWWIKNEASCGPHPKLARQEELQFGFVKKTLEIFPEAHLFELLYSPPGTKFNRHTDVGDSLRIVIPIIADEGAVWHFDDKRNVTQLPGHAYMVLKHYPHATDVLGPGPRVNFHFLLPIRMEEEIRNLKIHIG